MVSESVIEQKAGLDAIGVDHPDTAVHEAQVLAFDRRRAGRQEISPILVPLLRDPANAAPDFDHPSQFETPYRDYLAADPFRDQMAPARGIALGLTISMLFWGVVGYTIFR